MGLWLGIILSHTVDYNMYMNISTAVMTISVGADKSLVPRKILSGIFYAKFLCLFSGQTMFFLIFRIKADDVVMALDILALLILAIAEVGAHTGNREIILAAVQGGNAVILSRHKPRSCGS